MTKPILRLCLAATAIALLSACASAPVLAPAGKFQSLTLDRDWSDATTVYPGKGPKTKFLTVDGFLLNRLYVADGVGPADPLFISPTKGDTSTNPAPRGKADMSLTEQMEYVASAVGALDYQKVETSNPKPVMVGDTKGVRFELTAKTTEGLNIHGLAQAVSKKGLSYYVVYLAPQEHYYDATLKNAVAAMDSQKLP